MPRDYKVYLEDIVEAINKIQLHARNLSKHLGYYPKQVASS